MGGHAAGNGTRRPELAALSNARPAVVPFLPTLLAALAVAGLSVLSRPAPAPGPAPAVPEVVAAASPASPGGDGFHTAAEAAPLIAPLPAATAFARVYPLAADPVRAVAGPAHPPRPRLAAGRRPCGAGRCAEAARTASTAARARPEAPPVMPPPLREAAGSDPADGLPEGALPFASQAQAVIDAARALRSGTAMLEGPVLGSLVGLR